MALNDDQLDAMELMLANPEMKMEDVANRVNVTPRTFRRWRSLEEWQQEWEARDKQEVVRALRQKVLSKGDAALFNTYFKFVGGVDDETAEKMLRMSDEEALRIAKDAKAWLDE